MSTAIYDIAELDKPKLFGLTQAGVAPMLKNLERLGLLASTSELQKLAAAGHEVLPSLAAQKKFAPWEVDAAFKKFNTSPTERLAFKNSMTRAGLLTENPR